MKFCWCTLMVCDIEESVHFYTEILGLRIQSRFKVQPDTEIAFLGEGETKVELVSRKEARSQINEDIWLGFEVGSLNKMIDFVMEKGITIYMFEPNAQTKIYYVKDPDGLKIQFVEN